MCEGGQSRVCRLSPGAISPAELGKAFPAEAIEKEKAQKSVW